MAALSYTQAVALINATLRTNTVYLALFLSNPGADASGVEVTGGGYARQAITMSAPSVVNGKETSSNSAAVNFPAATSDWGDVHSWGIFSAATGGTLLWFGDFTRPKTIEKYDVERVPAGDLVVTLS